MVSAEFTGFATPLRSLSTEIADYFADKPEIAAVYLFGSSARGKARPLSDVDIAVLLKTDDEAFMRERRIDYLVELGRILRKDIHPVIMNHVGDELLRRIFSSGVCVLVRDERHLSRFRSAAFARMAEFGYYRAQFRRGVARGLGSGG